MNHLILNNGLVQLNLEDLNAKELNNIDKNPANKRISLWNKCLQSSLVRKILQFIKKIFCCKNEPKKALPLNNYKIEQPTVPQKLPGKINPIPKQPIIEDEIPEVKIPSTPQKIIELPPPPEPVKLIEINTPLIPKKIVELPPEPAPVELPKKVEGIEQIGTEPEIVYAPEGINHLKLRGYEEESINNQVKKADTLLEDLEPPSRFSKKKLEILEIMAKESINHMNSTQASNFMDAPYRGRQRYIICPSTTSGYLYTLVYLNEVGKIFRLRMKVNKEGEIVIDDKKFADLNACREQLNLTNPFTAEEIQARENIEKQISPDHMTPQALQNALKDQPIGKYVLRRSTFMDNYALYRVTKIDNEIRIINNLLIILPNGRISFRNGPLKDRDFQDFEDLKSTLQLI